MIQEQEERDFVVATDTDWDNADASQRGAESPEAAWVLTDRDVWHANPYYQGPPVPHPEDDYAYGDYEQQAGRAERDEIQWPEERMSDDAYEELLNTLAGDDEDIPF